MKLSLPRSSVQTLPDLWPDSRPIPWLIDLAEWLRISGQYCLPERQRILTSLLDHGTLAHAVESGALDPEDHPLLEAVFVESQPPVPYDNPAWDCPATWELGPPVPQLERHFRRESAARVDWKNWQSLVGYPEIKPISGGSPDAAAPAIERCADLLEKIRGLQAELDSYPADWSEHYYPY